VSICKQVFGWEKSCTMTAKLRSHDGLLPIEKSWFIHCSFWFYLAGLVGDTCYHAQGVAAQRTDTSIYNKYTLMPRCPTQFRPMRGLIDRGFSGGLYGQCARSLSVRAAFRCVDISLGPPLQREDCLWPITAMSSSP
jgi:hypothetical protein